MKEVVHADDEAPDFELPWLERWARADFSWAGLAKKESWNRGGGTLQDFIRRLERNASDDDLIQQGVLVACGEHGLHHVLFVPHEWAGSTAEISPERLETAKRGHWNKVINDGGVRDGSHVTIVGVVLPKDIQEALVNSFRASFEWISFNCTLRNIPRPGDRTFTNCQFSKEVIFLGVKKDAVAPAVHFTWCEFMSPLKVERTQGVELLDINGCKFRSAVSISESNIELMRIEFCTADYPLEMYDSLFKGQITLSASILTAIDCTNCVFESHVLFVDVVIKSFVKFLACDFKSRLTLNSMDWPDAAYGAASSSGSKFDGIVEIEGGDFPPVQFFQEAEFRSKVTLNWFSDREKRLSFDTELQAATSISDPAFNQQKHAQHVESGCRTLRKVAEASGDVHSEHFWHRNELIARRARGESSRSENGFSRMYGVLADYGLSITQPFLALAVSTVCFALVYAWLGGQAWTGSLDWSSIREGLGYSLNRTLPLGVFADDGSEWRKSLLGHAGDLSAIAVRLLATAQTITSAILVYLGVMAIRRKFRIS